MNVNADLARLDAMRSGKRHGGKVIHGFAVPSTAQGVAADKPGDKFAKNVRNSMNMVKKGFIS